MTSRRLSAPESWFCAAWNRSRALGSLRASGVSWMLLALAAYASYFINATQFVLKLRAARRDERNALMTVSSVSGSRA